MVSIIVLDWESAIVDNGVKHYNLYKDDILILQLNENRYVDFDLDINENHKYYVAAYTNDGDYLKSNILSIKTLSVDETTILNYTLNFNL